MKIIVIIFISFVTFCISCTDTTNTETGTLTGTVILEGQLDHSGIVIGIYELVELDPDIVEANTNWPHIGVIINQHTEFDHRFYTLNKTGETDASGYFEITSIPTGVYNVVAIKDGFGFKYVYEVDIDKGDNQLQMLKDDLLLYPETTISNDITVPTTWQTDHHYIIEQDINIGDDLTIEPGAVVRLNQGKEITNYGSINAIGEYENFIWFTKNDGFTENLSSVQLDPDYIWDRITFEPSSQARVQWCKFDWANITLINHINGFKISNCIFNECGAGFFACDVDSAFCQNLVCRDIDSESQAGIDFSGITYGYIEKNIISNCFTGIQIYNQSNNDAINNYICNCNKGILIMYDSSPIIENNEITSCDYGIETRRSHPSIRKNIIEAPLGIYCFYGNDEIHYNNILSESYAIKLWWVIDDIGINIDATNNYFYTTNNEEIQALIYDKDDVEIYNQIHIGTVYYNPFLTYEYAYSGIQDDK